MVGERHTDGMDRAREEAEGLTDLQRVELFWRILLVPLSRYMVTEMAERGFLKAGVGFAAPEPVSDGETESLRKLARGLHEQLRKTQDDLASLEVRYRKVCEQVPASFAKVPPRELSARRDQEKTVAYDTASDFEDAVSDQALTALPLKPRFTCETCVRRVKGDCHSSKSPQSHLCVGAGQAACSSYVPRPRTAPAAPATAIRKTFTRTGFSAVKCPGCGHTVHVKRDGALFAHDTAGREYRGKMGADPAAPCTRKGGKK